MSYPKNLLGLTEPFNIEDPAVRAAVQEIQDALVDIATQINNLPQTTETTEVENEFDDTALRRKDADLQRQINLLDFPVSVVTDAIKSISYSGGIYTVIMRELAIGPPSDEASNSYMLTAEETTFEFDAGGSPKTINIYVTNLYEPGSDGVQYVWGDSLGNVAGNDAFTQGREVDLTYFRSMQVGKITFNTPSSGQWVKIQDELPQTSLTPVGSAGNLVYDPVLYRVTLRNILRPDPVNKDWEAVPSLTSDAIPANTDGDIYLGQTVQETDTLVLQLGNAGLDTYEVVGHVQTDASQRLLGLADYSKYHRYVPLGGTANVGALDKSSNPITLRFYGGRFTEKTSP